MFRKTSGLFFSLSLMLLTSTANSAVILSTDFIGTLADPSNISWTESDVTVTNSMTPQNSGLSSLTLFGNKPNMYAVKHNIHDNGIWFTDIDLMSSATVESIVLESLSLDASVLNNSGNFQPVQRDLSFTLEIFSGITSIFSDTVIVFDGDGVSTPFNPTKGISFDLAGVNFLGDSSYTLRLTASGSGDGNNAGIDNLVLLGNSVFSPTINASTPSMFGLIMLVVFWMIRKRPR